MNNGRLLTAALIEQEYPLPDRHGTRRQSLDDALATLESLEEKYAEAIVNPDEKPRMMNRLARSWAGKTDEEYVWAGASIGELVRLVASTYLNSYESTLSGVKESVARRLAKKERQSVKQQKTVIESLHAQAAEVYKKLDTEMQEMKLKMRKAQECADVYKERMMKGGRSLDLYKEKRKEYLRKGEVNDAREQTVHLHDLQDALRRWDKEFQQSCYEVVLMADQISDFDVYLGVGRQEEEAYHSLATEYARMSAHLDMIMQAYEYGAIAKARKSFKAFGEMKIKYEEMQQLHSKRVSTVHNAMRRLGSRNYKGNMYEEACKASERITMR